MKHAKYLMHWLFVCMMLIGASAWTQDSVTYVYTDPQGTPLAEADASGNIAATFEYTPYGTYAPQGTSRPASAHSGPGYTGHVNDPETNLVYMQARYYDPATARFLSVDPDVSKNNAIFSFNRYVYADSNPIGNVDPNGRQTIPIANELGTDNPQLTYSAIAGQADFLASLLCACDASYYDPSGSGALQPVVTPFEFEAGEGVIAAGRGISRLAFAISSARGGILDGANYAQTTFSEGFSNAGAFKGETVDSIAAKLRSKNLSPNDVPVQYIVVDGQAVILNTRSSMALQRAGIPRSKWSVVNMTKNPQARARLMQQLKRNNLPPRGTPKPPIPTHKDH